MFVRIGRKTYYVGATHHRTSRTQNEARVAGPFCLSNRKRLELNNIGISQVGKKLLHEHRRARTCAPNSEEITTGQKRGQPSPPTLRVIIPRTESPISSSPTHSPVTTRSSVSSVGSVGKDMEIEEGKIDVGKMERRFEEGNKWMEKAKDWLVIVRRVLEDVERRGLDKKGL